ncbi:MAG: cyclic nucleotide-binding domain-containing protein [Candidatus Acidiferrales bacterium]
MGTIEPQSDESSSVRRFLASLPVLEGLDSADLSKVEANSTIISLESGGSLFHPSRLSQTFYVVMSGVLEVFGRPQSKNAAARLVPGDVFAEFALHSYRPRLTTILAAEPSQVISIPGNFVDSLLENRPSARAAITGEAARHLLCMHLASSEMFAELENSLFYYVIENSTFVTVKRGEVVIQEGEKSDCIYIVASGSLEVYREQDDGSVKAIDLLRDGACIGEMALLLNEPRSASVRAWRDSLLVRVSGDCVEHVFRNDAHVTFSLARSLGERLKRTTASVARAVTIKTISIVPWVDEAHFAAFCQRFHRAFESAGKNVAFLTRSGMREAANIAPTDPDASADRFYAWLADQEAALDYVLCRCEREASDWTTYCNEQADLVLFVCLPEGNGPSAEAKRQVEYCREKGARVELVLIQNPGVAPQGTAGWVDAAKFGAHHHLAIENDGHYERLVRRISGEAWGLVLSGGGARGLAHIGVIQALIENNIPIDWIGGTSMGAIVAAQYAMGMNPEEMVRASRKAYAGGAKDRDYTFPFVSLRSGRSTVQRLKGLFGDRRIEDLPLNYFCVSCNLTRAEVVIHDRGPLWMWVRVSCSIPGLLPPFPHSGDLLVDGGFLQNLPVETMRQRCGGRVIASDVSVAADLMVSEDLESTPSWLGLSHIARKLRKQPTLPDIFRILMRTAELSIVRDAKVSRDPTDLYLHPPLQDVGLTAFEEIDRIVAIGKEYASTRLQEWKVTHPRSLGLGD